MLNATNDRIAVLRQHFAGCQIEEGVLQQADCAASAFARPADFPTLFARPARQESAGPASTSRALPVFQAPLRGPAYQPTKPGTYTEHFERASAQPLFARPCKPVAAASNTTHVTQMQPQAKMVEHAFGYSLELELPGVNANALRVEVQGSQAVITGQQSSHGGRVLSTKGMPKGVFRTMHRLPAGVDPASLRANFSQGLLRINMRKQI